MQGAEEILNLMVFSKNMHDVATPGFNSLIPAPSIRSLVSTEPNEFFCRTNNINTVGPFCFAKQKQETVEVFLQLLFTNKRSSAQRARTKIPRQ